MAEEVDANDRTRVRRDGCGGALDVELPEPVTVDENRACAGLEQRQDGGDERVGRNEHLVARTETDRLVREPERGRPRADADAMRARGVAGPLLFEARHLLAEDVLRRSDHVEQRAIDLVLDRVVLPPQVDELDAVHGADDSWAAER